MTEARLSQCDVCLVHDFSADIFIWELHRLEQTPLGCMVLQIQILGNFNRFIASLANSAIFY